MIFVHNNNNLKINVLDSSIRYFFMQKEFHEIQLDQV